MVKDSLKKIFIALQVLLWCFLTLDLLGERITMSNSINYRRSPLFYVYASEGINKRSRNLFISLRYAFTPYIGYLFCCGLLSLWGDNLYNCFHFYGARITEL